MRLSRLTARALPPLLLVACVHPAPPVYLFSLSGSAGPDPIVAVAYSRVTGPPVEVPSVAEAGVAFLRPGPRGLELVATARRTAELHAALAHHPAYLHGAVGGPRPWVAIADDLYTGPREPLLARDVQGHARPPLTGRQPARIAGGVVSLEDTTLVAVDDEGHLRFRHALETAAPTECADDEPATIPPHLAVSPSGRIVAAVRAEVHRGAACVETVARLTRLDANGTSLGSDVVLRLSPPEALWNASPDPSRFGAAAVDIAQREDGTTLLAASTSQPSAQPGASSISAVRLVEASPDGTLHELRTVPGVVRALATAGTSWIVFLEPTGGTSSSTLVVVGADGRPLGDLSIPRRQVAILSLADGAFVAWRDDEHDICGVRYDEDGRRARVTCRRIVPP